MRKIHVFLMISLDGYFEGPNHDISWHNVDHEFNEYAIEMLREIGTMLYGRRTYQLMEEYWPKAEVDPKTAVDDRVVAKLMNETPKIAFSRSLKEVKEQEHWKNVQLRHSIDPDEIRKLKEQPGKDIWVGGSELATEFIKLGLVDEIRLSINPVVIGKGAPLFQGLNKMLELKLTRTRPFKSGNVLLYYDVENSK